MLPGSAFAQDSGDACALITAAEVSQALGVTVLPGHRMGSSTNNVCIFAPTAKFGPGERQIVVTVVPPALFDASRQSRGPVVMTPTTVPGADAVLSDPPDRHDDPRAEERQGVRGAHESR